MVPVLIIGASAILACTGAKRGYEGYQIISSTREEVNRAINTLRYYQGRHRNTQKNLTKLWQEVHKYIDTTIKSHIEKTLKEADLIKETKEGEPSFNGISGVEHLKIFLKSGTKGTLGSIATYNTAVFIGRASTGTAIRTLVGVAKKRAAFAWLGGGALEAGGGGMLMGEIALGAVGVGFGIYSFGSKFKKRALEERTRAEEILDEISIEINCLKIEIQKMIEMQKKLELTKKFLEESMLILKKHLEKADKETSLSLANSIVEVLSQLDSMVYNLSDAELDKYLQERLLETKELTRQLS